jgi:hypothetical protein
MGSGSETYLNLLVEAVRKGVVTPGTQVRVGFRMTPAGPRDAKLLHFAHRWNVLIAERRLNVAFHPGPDFDHAIRGLVIRTEGREFGAIGFYVRRNNSTYGQEHPLLPLHDDSDFGRMTFESCHQIILSRPSYPTINEAVQARDSS